MGYADAHRTYERSKIAGVLSVNQVLQIAKIRLELYEKALLTSRMILQQFAQFTWSFRASS
ncbi:MAG: hypothetical protein EA367_02385 [Leptolyngbya sp. DLM2.Bin15]|nr:MAG: hypothetical protein EA367_02385 [Leptolyngbya sp. DLM2.Bin15]